LLLFLKIYYNYNITYTLTLSFSEIRVGVIYGSFAITSLINLSSKGFDQKAALLSLSFDLVFDHFY
jgi:hypothetical protein